MKEIKDKRYSLVMPQTVYDEVEKIANNQGVTVVEVLRQYIKLGLLASKGEVSIATKDGNEAVLL